MAGPKGEPIEFDGVTYESAGALAKHLGVHVQTVRMARRRGRMDGLGKGQGKNPKHRKLPTGPFSIGKYKFESRSEASVALGHSRNYIGNILLLNIPSQMRALARKMVEYERKRDEEEQSNG